MLYLRPATMDDADILLSWRNDPITCANSRNVKPIPPKRHALWMSINVKFGYPTRIVLIGESDELPIGVIDFAAGDPFMRTYHVSITVDPKMRGRGFGFGMLALGCERMKHVPLTAEIRSANATSRALFSKCGFELESECDGFAQYLKEASFVDRPNKKVR